MRIALIILSVLTITSCTSKVVKDSTHANSRDTTILLKDALGQLKLTIPNRYDTFLVWTQRSDCGSCGTERYRFQRKRLPIFKESGFYWYDLKDSIDQLTIIHPQYIIVRDSASTDIIKDHHKKMLIKAKSDPMVYRDKNIFDTLLLINGRWNSLIIASSYDTLTRQYSKAVWGALLQKGNIINIQFSLLTKIKDSTNENFINNSRQQIMRIFQGNGT